MASERFLCNGSDKLKSRAPRREETSCIIYGCISGRRLPCQQAAVLSFSLDAPRLEALPRRLSGFQELVQTEGTHPVDETGNLKNKNPCFHITASPKTKTLVV